MYGKALKTARHHHKLTQVEASKRIGIDLGWLARIENDRGRPGIDTLWSAVLVYGLEPMALLRGRCNVQWAPRPPAPFSARRFGSMARYKRRDRDWSQSETADQLGVSGNYLSRIERGVVAPGFTLLVRMIDLLEIDLSILAIPDLHRHIDYHEITELAESLQLCPDRLQHVFAGLTRLSRIYGIEIESLRVDEHLLLWQWDGKIQGYRVTTSSHR